MAVFVDVILRDCPITIVNAEKALGPSAQFLSMCYTT